ncbi:hypothetical protein ES703_26731 [subsurface metagenome]
MSFDEQDWNRPVMGSGALGTALERRSLIHNSDGVVDRTAYPILYTSDIYKGKFFTRGMRGMLESIQVYCDGDGVDTLTLRYSPHPCLGPVGEVSIIPADGYAWQIFPVEEMWDYDSLFIWIYACTANITWGYDAWLPHDGHEYTVTGAAREDLGGTWAEIDIRPFIRVVYTGETPGDVPVSGIINNIPLPASSSQQEKEIVDITQGDIITIIDIHGAGYCDYIEASVSAGVDSDSTWIRVYCDGVFAGRWNFNLLNIRGHTTSTPTVSLTRFLADDNCDMLIHKRFEFRRRFIVAALNIVAPATVTIRAHPTLMR